MKSGNAGVQIGHDIPGGAVGMTRMIEETVMEHLAAETKLAVYMEVPEKPEEECIILEKTGGSERNYLETATLAVQSYGGSLYRAAEINELVKAAMRTLPEKTNVSRAALNSDYNFTDTKTKRYRYQAVYDIVY